MIHALLQSLQAETVVGFTLLRIGKNIVGKRNLFKFVAGVGILVGVEFLGQLSIALKVNEKYMFRLFESFEKNISKSLF